MKREPSKLYKILGPLFHYFIVCGRVPWLYQYWPGGFMLFVGLCPGTQPAVVLVLKRLRRRGNGFKSHPTD